MQRCGTALAGGLDDVDRAKAVGGPLRERRGALKDRGQVSGAERICGKRRKDTLDVLGTVQLDSGEHVTQVSHPWVARAPTGRDRTSGAYVILAEQQHLNRQVGVGQQRRERGQPVKHVHHRPALGRSADREHLAVLVHAHDAPLGRDGVHDPESVAVKERVKLGAQWTEAAGLDLDELSVSADDVDHEPADRDLQPVIGPSQHRLERSVQWALAQHANDRHAPEARGGIGAFPSAGVSPHDGQGALVLEVRQRCLHIAGDLVVDVVVFGVGAESLDEVDRGQDLDGDLRRKG